MTDLRTAAQQALEALKDDQYRMVETAEGHWEYKTDLAIAALEAALAQQAEPQDVELSAALGWPGGISNPVLDRKVLLQKVAALMQDKLWEDHRVRHLWDHTLAQQAEPVEPVAWRWGYRSVTTGEMDWRGYVEIAAHPNLRSPEIIMEPLYTAPPQRKPLTEEWVRSKCKETWVFETVMRWVRAVERAHGIVGQSEDENPSFG